MRRLSRAGLYLSVPYLVVLVAVFAYVNYRFLFSPRHTELLGLWMVFVTWPWGFWLLGKIQSASLLTALLFAAGLLNAAILYGVGRLLSKRRP